MMEIAPEVAPLQLSQQDSCSHRQKLIWVPAPQLRF